MTGRMSTTYYAGTVSLDAADYDVQISYPWGDYVLSRAGSRQTSTTSPPTRSRCRERHRVGVPRHVRHYPGSVYLCS